MTFRRSSCRESLLQNCGGHLQNVVIVGKTSPESIILRQNVRYLGKASAEKDSFRMHAIQYRRIFIKTYDILNCSDLHQMYDISGKAYA